MYITAKSRYALKFLLDLAETNIEPKTRAAIARRQGIPIKFMDHIIAKLRKTEIILTTRGRYGRVSLKKSPKEINLWFIFESVEKTMFPTKCIEYCPEENSCLARDAWLNIYNSLRKELSRKSLQEIVKTNQLDKGSDLNRKTPIIQCSRP